MSQNNDNNKQPSQELELLIEEYFRQFLKCRELYLEIENKAIKEEGFTIDEIAELVLIQRNKDVLRNINNNNITSRTTTITAKNNDVLYSHFQ
jgi:hypothetical protein